MSACEQLTETAIAGVAPALRAVECLANESAAGAFGRLFGGGGALMPALTLILTLYIAFFAVSLLTGRSRIGISALTPRMLTLGLVLTFSTSWAAYQGVVWNLTVGAPDQIAGVLMGTTGSATQLFGERIDLIFASVVDAAETNPAGDPRTFQQAAPTSFAPSTVMWLAALMLLLGTVGVLVTARIALAVLLVLGPVFVVLALFRGSRGLFAGWLRGIVLTASTPLFAVLCGGFMLELAVPAVAALQGPDGINGGAAVALFLIASIHIALMAMVLRVVGAMVAGWSVFGPSEKSTDQEHGPRLAAAQTFAVSPGHALTSTTIVGAGRSLSSLASPSHAGTHPAGDTASPGRRSVGSRNELTPVASATAPSSEFPVSRARGIGSRFAPPIKYHRR